MSLEIISDCPLCNNRKFIPFLECEDYTTTNEKFQLQKCTSCSFVVTSPRPDHQTLGKYYESDKYISHTGGSSSIFDSLYLVARKFTLRRKTTLIGKNRKPGKLLDYGCGTGEFLHIAADTGWEAFGVEPSDIAHSKANLPEHIHVAKTLSELHHHKFDVITLWHVLEHVPDLIQKISELRSQLLDNGTLFVAVPNHTSFDGQTYQEYWAGYDVPRHLWHFSKDSMALLAEKAQLKITGILPMKLDAYYVSLLSENYRTGKRSITGTIRAALIAFRSNLNAGSDNYSSLIYVMQK